jgi:3-phenylpropionate/trans-cinnamate dioxygenase ferredoxin reductase component
VSDDTVVVVGSGIAAFQTIQQLRTLGFTGDITLISEEDEPPYDRPPLSKGRDGVTSSLLPVDLAEFNVRRVIGTATSLNGLEDGSTTSLSVTVAGVDTTTQERAGFVVVATGAHAIVPPQWREVPAVHTLRGRGDARHMWQTLDALSAPARVVVIGASWIGMEFASVAAAEGMSVTVLERASHILPLVPPEIGRVVANWAQDSGIVVKLGASVADVTGDIGAVQVQTASEVFQADFVLAALGARPTTGWLADSGLRFGATGAMRVDEYMRSTHSRVLGVGDAVERWSPRYGTWMPGGHWQDARDEGAVAARTIMAELAGTDVTEQPGYDAIPYFWSEMFDRTLLWAGRAPTSPPQPRMAIRGALTEDEWTVCWLDEADRLMAVMGVNRPRDVMAARKAMTADPHGTPQTSPRCLTDVERSMRDCLG